LNSLIVPLTVAYSLSPPRSDKAEGFFTAGIAFYLNVGFRG